MTDPGCEWLHEVDAELALDVLPGRDRARAMAHLQDCPACERHIRELTVLGDRLVGLIPDAEPPVGFEQRVLDRLGVAGTRRHRPRRWRLGVAAAAVVLALGTGALGWFAHGALTPDVVPPSDDIVLTAVQSGGHQVGEVLAYVDIPYWLYVELSAPIEGTVSCQLRYADGAVLTVGWFPMTEGTGHWAGPAPLAGAAEVHLIAPDGSLIGTATLH